MHLFYDIVSFILVMPACPAAFLRSINIQTVLRNAIRVNVPKTQANVFHAEMIVAPLSMPKVVPVSW
jgi:hypothetical protein